MSHFLPARWLAILPAAAALGAQAQTAPPPAPAPQLSYRSAFEGYQAYKNDKPTPWVEANDTVGRIGGWRAYAKEAAEAEAPASPAPAADPHAGHARPASAPEPKR